MLKFACSRPEFTVYNIYRWYHGYFDHNPAHLLPRPQKEADAEFFRLIGNPQTILTRANDLFTEGNTQLALQALDLLIQNQPDHLEARKLRIKLLQTLCDDDYCLMSRNTWVYYIDRDKAFLSEQGIEP